MHKKALRLNTEGLIDRKLFNDCLYQRVSDDIGVVKFNKADVSYTLEFFGSDL